MTKRKKKKKVEDQEIFNLICKMKAKLNDKIDSIFIKEDSNERTS